MHTHIAFFFIKWGLIRNKGALPFCRLWSKPTKDESFAFSRNGFLSQSLHNQIALLAGQHICQPCHLHQPHNTHSP